MNSRKKMLMNLSESLESNLNRGGMNFSFCSARIAEAAKMETKGHFLLAWLPDSLNVSDPPVLFRGIWLRLPETLIISV